MRIRTLLLAATLPAASLCLADELVWTPLGPFEGAAILALGADPHTPGTLYASVDGTGLFGFFKSTDYGLTWSPTGLPTSRPGVTSIAFDHEPGVVWVVNSESLFKLTYGGVTWAPVRLPEFTPDDGNPHVYAVATDANVPNLVYLDVWFSFFGSTHPERALKSTNGGADWSVLPVGSGWTGCGGIRVDPFSSAVHFSSSFVSLDFGETWTTSDNWCNALAWDPSERNLLYRGSWNGVLDRSLDGGATWISVSEGLDGQGVNALAVDPFDTMRVYAGTSVGIFTRVFPKRVDPVRTPRSRGGTVEAPERP